MQVNTQGHTSTSGKTNNPNTSSGTISVQGHRATVRGKKPSRSGGITLHGKTASVGKK